MNGKADLRMSHFLNHFFKFCLSLIVSSFVFFICLASIWAVISPPPPVVKPLDSEVEVVELPDPDQAEEQSIKDASQCIDRLIQEQKTNFADCVDNQNSAAVLEQTTIVDPLPVEIAEVEHGKIDFISFTYELVFRSIFSTLIFVGIFVASLVAVWSVLCPIGSLKIYLGGFTAWSIDAPPVLGIVGTLFAMISYFASLTASDGLQFDGFFDSFVFAAASTIVGGLISVFNQFITSFSKSKG